MVKITFSKINVVHVHRRRYRKINFVHIHHRRHKKISIAHLHHRRHSVLPTVLESRNVNSSNQHDHMKEAKLLESFGSDTSGDLSSRIAFNAPIPSNLNVMDKFFATFLHITRTILHALVPCFKQHSL